MTRVDPNLWQVPQWHPDWDGEFQFENLRVLANSLLADTHLAVRLDVIEEGYVRLEVFSGDVRIGEVYVNRAEDRSRPQFAVFAGTGGEELQTSNLAEGVFFLSTRRTAYPEDAG